LLTSAECVAAISIAGGTQRKSKWFKMANFSTPQTVTFLGAQMPGEKSTLRKKLNARPGQVYIW
jgi:hypothetical protein